MTGEGAKRRRRQNERCPTPPQLEPNDDCAICLRPLCASRLRASVGGLPCGHVFHSGCLDLWAAGNKTCPYCRAAIPERPARAAGRKRSVSAAGRFYILLPTHFHNDAYAAVHGWRPRLGHTAVFCCDGSVRPEMRQLQRSTADAAAIVSTAKELLRLFFAHRVGPTPVVMDDHLVQPSVGIGHAGMVQQH